MPDTELHPSEQQVDGRASRWTDHKAARRERILDAAVEAIRELGGSVPVQDIATRASVPRSVVYRLFTDRADLDEQLRARIIGDLMGQVAPTLNPKGTIGEAIAHAVDSYVGWIVANPRLHQFLGAGSASRPSLGSRVLVGTRTAIAVQITTVIETVLRGRTDAPEIAEPLAFGLFGLVDATVNRWLSRSMQPLTPQQLSEFLQVSIWNLIDGHARRIGVELDLTTSLSDAMANPSSRPLS